MCLHKVAYLSFFIKQRTSLSNTWCTFAFTYSMHFPSAFLAHLSFILKLAHHSSSHLTLAHISFFSLKWHTFSFLNWCTFFNSQGVHLSSLKWRTFWNLTHFWSSFLLVKVAHLCHLTQLFTLGTWRTYEPWDRDSTETLWTFLMRLCQR